jgi:hypothetical protein
VLIICKENGSATAALPENQNMLLSPDQLKRLHACHSFSGRNAFFLMIQIDQDVPVIAHAYLFHITELPVPVTGLDSLNQVVMILLSHGVDQIHAGLIRRENIQ